MRAPFTDFSDITISQRVKHPEPLLPASLRLSLLPLRLLFFSRYIAATSAYLLGSGGADGDYFFPLHHDGYISYQGVWDGTIFRENSIIPIYPISFNSGDRISVYAQHLVGLTFVIKIRINGASIPSSVAFIGNQNCFVTVALFAGRFS